MESIIATIVKDSLDTAKRANRKEFKKALYSLIDTVAVASAGYKTDVRVKKLLKGIRGLPSGEHTVYGNWGKKTDFMKAILINSFSAHVLELDDWLGEGFLHPGASIVPSSIAVGEELELTLEDVLEGIMLGYEVAGRIGRLLGRKHYRRWHTTSTAGGMGVAAAVSWLRGKNEREVMEAVLIAGSYSSGILPVISRNAMIKPMSPTHAALVGVISASLTPLTRHEEEEYSYMEKMICKTLEGECEINTIKNPPWHHAINQVGFKVFPACRNSHTTIQAALKIRNKINPNEIKRVILEVFEEAYHVADIKHPLNIDEARFSLTFLTALTLLYGWPGFNTIKKTLADKQLWKLEEKITVKTRDDFTERFPIKQPVRIIVETINGEIIEKIEETPLGDPGNPLSSNELFKKEKMLAEYTNDKKLPELIETLVNASPNTNIKEIFR